MNNTCNNRPFISYPEAKLGLAQVHHTSGSGLIVHLLPHYSELQSQSAWKFMFIHQIDTDRRWCGGDWSLSIWSWQLDGKWFSISLVLPAFGITCTNERFFVLAENSFLCITVEKRCSKSPLPVFSHPECIIPSSFTQRPFKIHTTSPWDFQIKSQSTEFLSSSPCRLEDRGEVWIPSACLHLPCGHEWQPKGEAVPCLHVTPLESIRILTIFDQSLSSAVFSF